MTVDFFKQHGRIDSPIIVVGVLVIVLGWLWRRPLARGPRRLLIGFVAMYWLLATPIGAGLLVSGLSRGLTPLQSREAARGADAVVLLGGGADTLSAGGVVLGLLTPGSTLRALEAARVYKAISARLVIVSGGIPSPGRLLKPESDMLRDALVSAGVPADRIQQDPAPLTTRDHPRTLRPILEANKVARFVLVTSPTHMRRALAVFHAVGLEPIPSVSLLRSENLSSPAWLVPNDESLYLSAQATYEYAAWLYYWWGGWI